MTRFERLRGNALIPRGRENAARRLSDDEIASAVLGFVHPMPGWAGHTSLILGDLRPVGGQQAAYRGTSNLLKEIGSLIEQPESSDRLLKVTLSIGRDFGKESYACEIYYQRNQEARVTSYVSKYAYSLLSPGAEREYVHGRLDTLSAIQQSFGPSFFRSLAKAVLLSRQIDRPWKTDWREYESEEEKEAFHKRLGARRSSDFLNLRVDAQVTWPREPTRIKFGGHHFVLFPKTAENSHSISIDLASERISVDEARSLINLMLSVMSWCADQPASLHDGWSGNPVPVPVSKANPAFVTTNTWVFYREPPLDERLRRCLAFYRDGLNALSVGLASHAVLSFYRVLETKSETSKKAAIEWIDAAVNEIGLQGSDSFQAYEAHRTSMQLGHGAYIYKWCRVATAHAALDAPSNPDEAEEERRLLDAARVIKVFARHLIKQEFKFSDSYLTEELD